MEDTITRKVITGTIWSACDRFGVMTLQFIVNLILARLLTPSDFGIIGMLYIFIALSMTLIDGGFGSALIQKKEPSEIDYSTIFYWSLIIGSLIYTILYFTAPLIAYFYRTPILIPVLRAIGLTIIFSSISNIQDNRLRKQLNFKQLAISNIGTYVCASIIAIIMAYNGYGVWSLTVMMLAQGVGRIIWIYVISKWFPFPTFSLKAFKSLFSFGGYLFLSFVLESICKNIQGLVIGKQFSAAQMGYYSQASKLDNVTSYAIPQTVASVMFPIMSKYQNDNENLKILLETNLRIITSLIYPLLSILIITAYPLIILLYGHQWSESVQYYQILCTGGFFMCINNIPYYAIAASGKSKALLLLSFYKWGCLGIFIIIGMNFGMDGIVWSLSISIANIFFANSWLANKYIGFRIKDCIKSILPAFVTSSLSMGLIIILMNYLNIYWGLSIIAYIILYICLSLIINKKGVDLSLKMISKLKRKND